MNYQYLLSFDLRNESTSVALCSIDHPEEHASIIKELPSAIIIDEDDYVEIGARAIYFKAISNYQYKCIEDLFCEPKEIDGEKEMGMMQFIASLYDSVQTENYQFLNGNNEIVVFYVPDGWKDTGKKIWKEMLRIAIPENAPIVILPEQRLCRYANSNRAIALGEIARADHLTKDAREMMPTLFQNRRDAIVEIIEQYHKELISSTIRSVKDICKKYRDEEIESLSLFWLKNSVLDTIRKNEETKIRYFQQQIQNEIEGLRTRIVSVGNSYFYTGQIKNASIDDFDCVSIDSLELDLLFERCCSFIYDRTKFSRFQSANSNDLEMVMKKELDQRQRRNVINNVFCFDQNRKPEFWESEGSNIFEVIEDSFNSSFIEYKNNILSQVDKHICEYLCLLKVITIL